MGSSFRASGVECDRDGTLTPRSYTFRGHITVRSKSSPNIGLFSPTFLNVIIISTSESYNYSHLAPTQALGDTIEP